MNQECFTLKSQVNIILMDDYYLVRKAIRMVLEKINGLNIVAEAECGLEVLKMLNEHSVDIILLDFEMPNINGIIATERILKEYPEIKIIMLSSYSDFEYISQSLNAGAKGYLLKSIKMNQFVDAINDVMNGNIYLDKDFKDKYELYHANKPNTSNSPINMLTTRQKEVFQLITEGHSYKEIAHMLNISVKTVDMHRHNLMEALNIFSIPQLVQFAAQQKII